MGLSSGYIIREGDREPFVSVLPDLRFPRYAAIDVTKDERSELDVSLGLVFDPQEFRYVVDTMTVNRRNQWSEVNGAALRTIPVQEYVRSLQWAGRIEPSGETVPNPFPPERAEEIKRNGPSDPNSLLWLARIYVVANALSRPPGKAVQEALDMPAPTASVWIRRARDRGLIPDTLDRVDRAMSEEEFKRARVVLRDG